MRGRKLAAVLLSCLMFLMAELGVYASDITKELDEIIPCTEEFMFEDGDIVGFIGDSITQVEYTGISYQEFIYNYYMTRFPQWNLEFRNLGTSSYTAEDALALFGETKGIHDEALEGINKAVIMFGMNEALSLTSTAEYIRNIRQLTELLNEKGISNENIILAAPTPYDQTTATNLDENGEMKERTDDILSLYVPELKALAEELGTHFVDLHTPMLWITEMVQDKIAGDTLTVTDSVHPNAMGNVFVGFFFLYQQGAGKEVASVYIRADETVEAENAEVTSLKAKGDQYLRYKYQPASLPMAVTYEFHEATQYFQIVNEISYEGLRVDGLEKDAAYQVLMDGYAIGEFTGKELAEGINLTDRDLNPGQIEARKMEELNQKWQLLSSDYRAVLRQATKEPGSISQQAVDEAYGAWKSNTEELHDQMYQLVRESVKNTYTVEIIKEGYQVYLGQEPWVWGLGAAAVIGGVAAVVFWVNKNRINDSKERPLENR